MKSKLTPQLGERIASRVLSAVNDIRREVGEEELNSLPAGARSDPERNCPIARALTALVLPAERRIAFHHPWYASAATKLWKVPFTDPFLLSVVMPEVAYLFVVAFRAGELPEFEERN
jgi:hypothetical protein